MSVLNSDLTLVLAVVVGLFVLWHPLSRRIVGKHSSAIGIVFGLIAGAYVLVEHQIAEKNSRLDRTRGYIERIESGSVHESRQWFDLHWIKNRQQIEQISEALYGKAADLEAAEQLKEVYMRDFEETDEADAIHVRHLVRLMYFYADLAKCVELGLCDAKTACEIFANDIGTFYVLHSEFIEKWRQVSFEQNFRVIKAFLNKTCGVG